MPSEIKYKDTKFIYNQHLAKKQNVKALIIKLKRFFIKECLNKIKK